MNKIPKITSVSRSKKKFNGGIKATVVIVGHVHLAARSLRLLRLKKTKEQNGGVV